MSYRVGKRNLITDVPGVLVGNATNQHVKTGTTVLTAKHPLVAGMHIMGGAPGTRDTECLAPDRLVSEVHALVLSGGSAFGLDAASGVTERLLATRTGFPVGPFVVPIVPTAILFDLLAGGENWMDNPYQELGAQAFDACAEMFELGAVGAGTGATTATLKGGLGSASLICANGITVGALVAVNPHGSAVVPGTEHFWAAPFEVAGEFGDRGITPPNDPLSEPANEKLAAFAAQANTTIAIIATDAALDKAQAQRLATAAHDGLARALVPAHTLYDGDLVFAVSAGNKPLTNPVADAMTLGHAASLCLSRAIARGVYEASTMPGDILPTWQSLHSNAKL